MMKEDVEQKWKEEFDKRRHKYSAKNRGIVEGTHHFPKPF